MINVSNGFKELMQQDTYFQENAEITFVDGTVLELSEQDFTVSNNSVIETSGSGSLPIGEAIARQIQIELDNHDERYASYDFYGASIRLYLTYQLSETVERIEFGTFTVITPETYGTTVIITAQDDMYKADRKYSTGLAFPATASEVLIDTCDTCGILLYSSDFNNHDFVIEEKPSGEYTFRQVIGWIAMIAGGNARINRQGYLEILNYSFATIPENYSGGTFAPWTVGDELDGGTFSPWTAGDTVDDGIFGAMDDIHILSGFANLKVDTNDIEITGISLSAESDGGSETVLYGTDGYVIAIKNPVVSGKEQELLSLIGPGIVGAKFRKFEGDHIAYPLAEFMDPAIVCDRNGNVYSTIITDIDFVFFGYTTFKNCAESAIRNASCFSSDSGDTLVEARKLVKAEKTARELAVANLNKALAESSGMYSTAVEQEDGSVITYLHDKPTLEESANVLKVTANAIGFSTDGGKTYPYGVTLDGQTITRILYAEGINADYINAGTMFADRIRGGTLFLGGDKNTNGAMLIYDADGKSVGYIDNTGVHFEQGSFAGTITSGKGEIAGWTISENAIASVNNLIKLIASGAIELTGSGYIKFGKTTLTTYGNAMRIDGGLWVYNGTDAFSDGSDQMKFFNLPHVSSGGYLVFGTDGSTVSYLASSSRRYKDIGRVLDSADVKNSFDVDVYWAKYKGGYLDHTDPMDGKYMPMFLAEDIEQKIPSAAVYRNGQIEDWNSRVMIPVMFQMIKELKKENEEIKQQLSKLMEVSS